MFIKTKKLVIIFIALMLITMASGLVILLTQGKKQPVVNELPNVVERPAELVTSEPTTATSTKTTTNAPGKNKIPPAPFVKGGDNAAVPAEEKINAAMIIDGVRYETAVKPGSSAYDAMNLLKAENKISFSGRDYKELGFFVEEINGVRNDPSGKNWVYYVNGSPAPVGISNYLIKANDIIEWKYEKKNF